MFNTDSISGYFKFETFFLVHSKAKMGYRPQSPGT